LLHPLHQFQKFDLARRRQRRFRLVEDENALPLVALLKEAQKAFAVGMGEEVRRGAGGNAGNIFEVDLILVSSNRKEALGAKEPSVANLRQPTRAKGFESCPPIFSSALE
jgi:aspartyl aminopeptidase